MRETSAQLWFRCLSQIATSGSGRVLTHPDNNQNRQDAAITLTFVRSRPDPNVAAHAPGMLCSAAWSVHKNSYAEVSEKRRSRGGRSESTNDLALLSAPFDELRANS
jgi:hypothetical protein